VMGFANPAGENDKAVGRLVKLLQYFSVLAATNDLDSS